MKKILFTLSLCLLLNTISAQTPKVRGLNSITMSSIKAQTAFLASDLIEGREAGERGGKIAGEFIASQFGTLSVKPFFHVYDGYLSQYLQPFDAVRIDGTTTKLSFTNKNRTFFFESGIDYTGLRLSEFSFDIVNAEYLIIDSLNAKDAAGKIAVYKGAATDKIVGEAIKAGAVGVLFHDSVVWQKNTATKGIEYHYNEPIYEGFTPRKVFKDSRIVLPAATITHTPMIAISDRLMTIFSEKKDGSVSINIESEAKKVSLRNIVAVIEGEVADEYVVVGAHYDHYGIQDGYIYNGADDNASGAVAVMQIAKAFMESGIKPKRSIIFALWDGEERGLLGSKFFVQDKALMSKIKGYMNFDMIGRNSDESNPQSFAYFYTQAYPKFADWINKNIKEHNLNLKPGMAPWDNPVGGSDNASFALEKIPIIWYHTGGNPDYHQPTDHVGKINWDKMLDIIKSAYLGMWNMANE